MAATAQVKDNVCTDAAKPLYPPIEVGSDFWFSWLREPQAKSFHFESEAGKYTARREERRTSGNDYWYAYRKIQGKLRKVYLGTPDELTRTRLNEVAVEISQSSSEFYSTRKSYPREKLQSCVTEVSPLLPASSYPTEEKFYRVTAANTAEQGSCVTDNSEVEALRAEVEQLLKEVAVLQQENSNLQGDNKFQEDRWSLTEERNKEIYAEAEEIKRFNEALIRGQSAMGQERNQLDSELEQLRSQLVAAQDELHLQETITKQVRQECDELRELVSELRFERSQLDQEISVLHAKVGDLDLENANLREAMEQMRKQASRATADPSVIALLQNAITPKSKGGSYAANNATGIKRLVELALGQLSEPGG